MKQLINLILALIFCISFVSAIDCSLGDPDGSGIVTGSDITYFKQYISKGITSAPCNDPLNQWYLMDINKDGILDIKDLNLAGDYITKDSDVVINHPPVISNIPDVSFDEDTIFTFTKADLDAYASDFEGPITWDVSGNSKITFSYNPILAKFVATPESNWFGSETLTFTACDSDNACVTDDVIVTINSINDLPVMLDLPTIEFNEDTVFTFSKADLDSFASDVEGPITWSIIGIPENSKLKASYDSVLDKFVITPEANWFGSETFTISACDSDNACVTDDITINVKDVPEVSSNPSSGGNSGGSSHNHDNIVAQPATPAVPAIPTVEPAIPAVPASENKETTENTNEITGFSVVDSIKQNPALSVGLGLILISILGSAFYFRKEIYLFFSIN